ncbi:MAG: hypothetical protein AAF655_20910 [Bacteroidota bacterium]
MRINQLYFLGVILLSTLLTGGCKNTRSLITHYDMPSTEEEYRQHIQSLQAEIAAPRVPYKLTLSQEEMLLDSLLDHERKELLDQYEEEGYFPPARYFFGWQKHMEATQLFKVISHMPKGGIHHLHGSASLTADWIMNKAMATEEAYVYWGPPSEIYKKGQVSVFSLEEVPTGFFRPTALQKSDSSFREYWYDLLTLDSKAEADSVDIWSEFEGYFESVYNFLSYRPVYEAFYRASFLHLMSDGIQHVELRNGFEGMYDLTHDQSYYTADSMIQILQNLEKEMQEQEPAFSLSLIYSNLRRRDTEFIQTDMERAIFLRKKYPDMMKGYDLVGEEDAGHRTGFFAKNWVAIKELEEQYAITLPLYLHNGESNWVTNDNLLDTYLLRSRRIGHGFNLYRFPALWEKLKDRDVCVEICPISNQVLGYIRDLRNHPGYLYIQLGIPVSISSDDPSIFQYKGVSPDYWAVYLAWNLDLSTVKKLCQNSLLYSSLSEERKLQSLAAWERKWDVFVKTSIQDLQSD